MIEYWAIYLLKKKKKLLLLSVTTNDLGFGKKKYSYIDLLYLSVICINVKY